MFDYDKALKKLREFPQLSQRRQRKAIKKLLFDDEFIEWLFDSGKEGSKPITVNQVDDLYTELAKPKALKAIIEVINTEGYDVFTRSHACFIYSICNFAIEANNERMKLLSKDIKEKALNNREAKDLKVKLEKYSDLVAQVIKSCRKIVKRDAKKLASNSNVPKDICIHAYWHVPDIDYVPNYKVGFYLNGLLNIIYKDVSETGFADRTRIYWKPFFKEIFGKENLPNVATFILLEGVNRIDKYKDLDGIDSVKACWDSLTEFALKELNDAPDAVRNQMLELYVKRIDKMFKNSTYDLRVNMLSLPRQFSNLISTVQKYADKIKKILKQDEEQDKSC